MKKSAAGENTKKQDTHWTYKDTITDLNPDPEIFLVRSISTLNPHFNMKLWPNDETQHT